MKNDFFSIYNFNIYGFKRFFSMNRFNIGIKKKSTIIIAFTIFIISVLNVSCKTCKCPAYSYTKYKTSANSGNPTV
jgi:hypothetical protein